MIAAAAVTPPGTGAANAQGNIIDARATAMKTLGGSLRRVGQAASAEDARGPAAAIAGRGRPASKPCSPKAPADRPPAPSPKSGRTWPTSRAKLAALKDAARGPRLGGQGLGPGRGEDGGEERRRHLRRLPPGLPGAEVVSGQEFTTEAVRRRVKGASNHVMPRPTGPASPTSRKSGGASTLFWITRTSRVMTTCFGSASRVMPAGPAMTIWRCSSPPHCLCGSIIENLDTRDAACPPAPGRIRFSGRLDALISPGSCLTV